MIEKKEPWDFRYNHEAAIERFVNLHVDAVDRWNGRGEADREFAEQAMRNIQAKAWDEGRSSFRTEANPYQEDE